MQPLRILALLLVIGLSFAMPAFAGQLEDGIKAVERQDYSTALALLRPLAEQGDELGQFYLGVMYEKGHGVSHDYVEAHKWYQKSAEQGNAKAQYYLGWMDAEGQGVPQDYVEAHKWFNLAIAHLSDKGLRDGSVYKRDCVAALMTPSLIAEAQKRASEWKPMKKPPK